jgi:hypothetical protein
VTLSTATAAVDASDTPKSTVKIQSAGDFMMISISVAARAKREVAAHVLMTVSA